MIVLQNMGGIAPMLTPAALSDNLAQAANNLVLYKGGVTPLKGATSITTLAKQGNKKSIYRFGIGADETKYWFSWTTPVNVVKGPIAGDTSERTYFTGDGVPKKTDFTLATSGGTTYPVAAYNLGVPAPTSAPILTQVSDTGPAVQESRAYVYTHVTAWGEESSPSLAAIGVADSTHVLQLSGFAKIPTGQYNIVTRRIYRSVTSSSGTNYYWVGDISSSTDVFVDNVAATGIAQRARRGSVGRCGVAAGI